MFEGTIDKILELQRPEIIEVHDKVYNPRKGSFVGPPLPPALEVKTLTGFVDALKEYIAQELEVGTVIHVVSHKLVELVGQPDEYGRAEVRLRASLPDSTAVRFGHYNSLEEFNIILQAFFERTATVESLLKIVGNVTDGNVSTYADDGVGQTVTAKTGVQYAKVEVPNPVGLSPFRTFREIEQPESLFIFRMKGVEKGMPLCCLVEGDGGRWKNTAVMFIKSWLEENTDGLAAIIA